MTPGKIPPLKGVRPDGLPWDYVCTLEVIYMLNISQRTLTNWVKSGKINSLGTFKGDPRSRGRAVNIYWRPQVEALARALGQPEIDILDGAGYDGQAYYDGLPY